MATIFIRKGISHDALMEAVDAHNSQSRVGDYWTRRKNADLIYDKVSRYHGDVNEVIDREFEDVRVLAVRPDARGLTCVVLDPEHPKTHEVRAWLDEQIDVKGWKLAEDGELSFPLQDLSRKKAKDQIGWDQSHYNEGYDPMVVVRLTQSDDGEAVLDYRPFAPDRAIISEPVLWVQTTAGRTACVPNYEPRLNPGGGQMTVTRAELPLSRGEDSEPVELWAYCDDRWRHKGYDLRGTPVDGLMGKGVGRTMLSRAGVPATHLEIESARQTRQSVIEPKRTGRFMEIVDEECGPAMGAMRTFPYWSATDESLIRREVREVTRSYRTKREATWVETNTRPLVFGLTKSQKDICVFQPLEVGMTYPAYRSHSEKRGFELSLPGARFMVTRSVLGWHGVFILTLRIGVNHPQTPEAHAAYVIPVFQRHEDSKHHHGRYRHLHATVIRALRETHGIEHFIQQALFELQGAKVKARRMGIDLDGVTPLDQIDRVPPGHAILAYNPGPFMVDGHRETRSRVGVSRYIAEMLGFANGNGHVPLGFPGEDDLPQTERTCYTPSNRFLNDNEDEPVQRVAAGHVVRRALDI